LLAGTGNGPASVESFQAIHHPCEIMDSIAKLVMECILETKAATILEFVHGLRGSLHVAFEEGTCAAWLHE
jgi:hypothetical protein